MGTIRVAWGTGAGPTSLASFDAALADAGVNEYNLETVSSVIPGDATLEVVETAPDLGPVGDRLRVVLSRWTASPGADLPAVAGLGWARSDAGPGVFYEGVGGDADAIRAEIREGLAHAAALRDWHVAERDVVVRAHGPDPDAFASAVVVGIYGESRSVF